MRKTMDVEAAYRQSGHLVLRRAQSILGSESAAQEALQEIFLSLLKQPTQFTGRSSITTFLYSATTHHCLNVLRNQRKRGQLLAQHGESLSKSKAATMDEQILATEMLATLPPRLATVAVYYYIDEMSQDEIAEILGLSRRMVGKLLTKLRSQFKQELVA